jgi:hypothetical protein
LSPVRSFSPIRPLISSVSDDSLEKIRENTLIQRFNELYSRERLDALDTLRTVSDDYDMNQRICFNIIQVRKRLFFINKMNRIVFDSFRKPFL